MGICYLSLITKPLDKLCMVHSFKRTPLPLPPSLIFMASLPRYQKTYLLCTISLEYSTTVKKIQNCDENKWGREGEGGPFERMDHAQLIQGFSDQTKVADAHFLVWVIELTPFLSISVCWFWFWLSQTRKWSPEEMGLLVWKGGWAESYRWNKICHFGV